MEINIKELPTEVQVQIPLTIRTFKQFYEYDELPSTIRKIIDPYIKKHTDVKYNIIYDVKPKISEYGDLQVIADVRELVVEYLRAYLLISPTDYPNDALFGCKLKQYLNVKDTETKRLLIQNEVENIINVVSNDLQIPVELHSVNIETTSPGVYIEYHITINLIVDSQPTKLVVSISNS